MTGPVMFSVEGDTVGTVGARCQAEEPELFTAALTGNLQTVDLTVLRSSFGDAVWYSTISFELD